MRKIISAVTIGFAVFVLSGVSSNAHGFGTFYTGGGSASSGMRIASSGTVSGGTVTSSALRSDSGQTGTEGGEPAAVYAQETVSGSTAVSQLHITAPGTYTIESQMVEFAYMAEYFLFSKRMEDRYNYHYGQENVWVEMVSYGAECGDWFINIYSGPANESDCDIPIFVITKDTVRFNVISDIDGRKEIDNSRLFIRYGNEIVEVSKRIKSITIDEMPNANNRQIEFIESAYPGLASITLMETTDKITGDVIYQGFDGTHTLPIFEYNADYFVVYDVETLNGKDRVVASTVWERIGPLAEIYQFVCHIEGREEKLKTVKKKMSSGLGITDEMWEFYDNVTSGDKKVWVQFITYSDSDQEYLDFDTADEFRIFNYGYGIPAVITKSNGDVGVQQVWFEDKQEKVVFYRTWVLMDGDYVMDQVSGWVDWDNRENIPYFQEFSYEFPFK